MLQTLALLLAPTLASAAGASSSSSTCGTHSTRGECLAFRLQHDCVWDVPTKACQASTPCDKRSQQTCETELTTGADAKWDATTNKCFFDSVQNKCRFSDECYGLEKSACAAAACKVEHICTPADMRARPGPNHCADVCVAKPAAAPPPSSSPNATAPSASSAAARAGAAPAPNAATTTSRGGIGGPVVRTTSGTVQGSTSSSGIDTFRGVPFAEAPVGELRFAAPSPISWSGTLDATSNGATCSQNNEYYITNRSLCQGYTRGQGSCAGYSEDCLNMNIFTPSASSSSASSSSNASSSTKGARAVMVWIHGGCFVSGSAAGYDGDALAEAHDVVVVVVQYRLGAFGFLGGDALRSRDPGGSTGNWGLLDNIAALEWVHDNIASFGGDPDRVTIFGESSGAGSVGQLLGVKPAWPYFHRAIMESGTASFWTYIPLATAAESYDTVLSKSGCAGSSDEVKCLLGAASNAVGNAVSGVPCRDACNWAPVIDGVLVRGMTLTLAQSGELRPKTPIISGFNLNDGAMFVDGYPFAQYTMSESSLKSYFSKRYGEERVDELKKLFPVPGSFPGCALCANAFHAAQACETDFSYSCTALWTTKAVAGGDAYVYQFSEGGDEGLVLHGDEIPYVFGSLGSRASKSQAKASQMMMEYWSNFAKTGDPNTGDEEAGEGKASDLLRWPAWDAKGGALINITSSPVIVDKPPGTYPGCPFFEEHWDFYSQCLPP